MDVYKSGSADGTNVQQYGTTAGKANNTWKLRDAGDGYYYIVSQLSNGTSGYLTVEKGSADNGDNVVISSFAGSDSQKFMIKPASGGYQLLTKCSGEKLCVEVADASPDAGANVQQWTLNGNNCQIWQIEKI